MHLTKLSYKAPKSIIASAVMASLLGGGLYSPVSFAQEAAVLEELIVTARKREESLQDVPIAITALNAASIERAYVSEVDEIDKLVPNIELSDISFAGAALGATIRGVGFAGIEKSSEPAVGFSIDGVFLATNGGAAIDVFDVEKIEVLRGPQGTLFGRNTVGGVINVVRTRPTIESGLKLGTRLSNNGGVDLSIVANTGQVGDVLSTKFYAFSKEDETFATNTFTGSREDQADNVSYGVTFLYEPNDRLQALVSIDAFDDDSQGTPLFNLTQPGELFCDLPNLLTSFGVFAPGTLNAGCASRSLDVGEASDFSLFTREAPFVSSVEGSSFTANIEYEISENLTFTSITGYRETDEQLLNEGLGAPSLQINAGPGVVLNAPILATNRLTESEQFSQELRLSGNINEKLTFVSGIIFSQSEFEVGPGVFPNEGFIPGLGLAQSFGAIDQNSFYAQETTSFAIFADGTYDLNDRLSLSAGLRFSYEEKDAFRSFALSSVPGVSGTSIALTEDYSNPTGRIILQYQLGNDASIYGGYSRGFRSGGFDAASQTTTDLGPYDEEFVDSFELGVRAEFFDNRLRVNPTIFYTDYTDRQEEITTAVPGGGAGAIQTVIQNASEAEIFGLELEVLAQVSPGLTLRGSLGLLDAEFTSFLVPENPADPNNTNLVDESDIRNLRSGPDATASVGATYIRSLGANGTLAFNAAYYWQDDITTAASVDVLALGRDMVEGNEGFDFSLTYETQRDTGTNFTLTAFINDAFDSDEGRLATQIVVPGILTFGATQATTIYGIEATVEF